jgi:hypothetical protein
MNPKDERQRRKEQVLPAAAQMPARINAYGRDDETASDVALWGEAHAMTVTSIILEWAALAAWNRAATDLTPRRWPHSRRTGTVARAVY